MNRETIEKLQKILNRDYGAALVVDGLWGPNTEGAIHDAYGTEEKTVRELAAEIVGREGGYVNDPDDPGGATKYGVTIGTMQHIGMDLDGDGVVTVADVKALTREQAIEVFIKYYFDLPAIGLLPETLHAPVFDMQVNSGVNAIRILQRLLSEILDRRIADDGIIGPKTIAAAEEALSRFPNLRDLYGDARRDYYFRLADRRPASRKYARTRAGGKGGWIKRAEEFMSPPARMTDAQFQARTRAWA